MDVGTISSLSAAISSNRLSQVQSESQVSLIKKQNKQQAQVASTIIEGTNLQQENKNPEKGNLLAVA